MNAPSLHSHGLRRQGLYHALLPWFAALLLLLPAPLPGAEKPLPVSDMPALEKKLGGEVTLEGIFSKLEFLPEIQVYQLSFLENPAVKIWIGTDLARSGSWRLDQRLGTKITVTGPLVRQKTDLTIHLYTPTQLASGLKEPESAVTSLPMATGAGYESITIQALLVGDFGSNRYGASVNSLTLSLMPGRQGMTFSQPVGKMMQGSVDSVQKAYLSKGAPLPDKMGLQLTFADKQSFKDGPSAGLPMALLLDCLLEKKTIPKELAATGDVGPDRKVHAVGAVADKIRAAYKANCKLILIPKENGGVLTDMALDGDLDPIIGTTIVLIETVDQAVGILSQWQSTGMDNPYKAYEPVAATLKTKGAQYLQYGHFREELKQLAAACPENASAHILRLHASGGLPERYSLMGSFEKLEQALAPFSSLMNDLEEGRSDENLSIHTDSITKTLDQLSNIQNKLDPRLSEYSQSLYQFMDTMYQFFRIDSRAKRKSLVPELESRSSKVKAERQKLLDDPSIRDTLM